MKRIFSYIIVTLMLVTALPLVAKEYKVDGVIDVNLKFCCLYDTEGYNVEKAMKAAGIPVLGIETDYTDTDAEQLKTRVQAFVEMLG